MKQLFKPSVLIPAVIGVGLLAALIGIGGPGRIIALLGRFKRIDLLWLFLLMVAYETVRGYQWQYLLKKQKVVLPLKGMILAFLLGETTKAMPLGNYFQNYVLMEEWEAGHSRGGSLFIRTAAASTLIIIGEIVICVAVLAVTGLGELSRAVRSVIVIGIPLSIAGTLIVRNAYRSGGMQGWTHAKGVWKRKLGTALETFVDGSKSILHLRIVAVALACSVLYIFIATLMLHVTLDGAGVANLSLTGSLAAYCFSLGVSLVLPLPTDIGVTEAAGAGALVLFGIAWRAATASMLVFRALSVAASVLVIILALPFLHRELRLALTGAMSA